MVRKVVFNRSTDNLNFNMSFQESVYNIEDGLTHSCNTAEIVSEFLF